ncbi:hypothetical protein GDO86_014503 [Hymenochirus boettgeri]|uniref:Uncharacterized protein n=1 Tax=Hymenochirus boettgeri TaxID=247094 RepID=A0A8T2JXJ0_9PIPI|nr:hypothetical protein GDO86_014503 [Hymenochirus boettgeri]
MSDTTGLEHNKSTWTICWGKKFSHHPVSNVAKRIPSIPYTARPTTVQPPLPYKPSQSDQTSIVGMRSLLGWGIRRSLNKWRNL